MNEKADSISKIMRDDWTDFVPSYYSYYDAFVRMRNEKKKLKKQRRIFFLVIAIAVLFIIFAPFADSKERNEEMPVYCVKEGDTLWSIAQKYNGENVSTMEFVYDIKAANDMKSSALSVGELIMIPE